MGELLTQVMLGHEHHDATSVSEITSRLLRTMDGQDETGGKNWQLIQEMLTYAAEAEQQLSDQQDRIDQLESLAHTDHLTGLLNRRGFHNALDRVLSEAARHDERGLIAFIDLDQFKPINDQHGHTAGDEVLRNVADTLIAGVRSTDYVARLAGDEFVVLFARAERAARERALLLKDMLNGLLVPYDGNLIRVGASMGIQTYGKTSTAEDLLRRADKAMYRDKANRKAA